jgi:hypothetical protein
VPPNPKLLLIATSTATPAEAPMTCLKAELVGSGFVRLSVSGTLPSRIASIANAASSAPAHQHIHVDRCMHVKLRLVNEQSSTFERNDCSVGDQVFKCGAENTDEVPLKAGCSVE